MAIDERMVKSGHRSGIRHCVKEKPIKWGIKLSVLVGSFNGYTIDFNIYIGKDAARGVGEFELGHDVVVKLISRYYYQGITFVLTIFILQFIS